MSIKYIFLSVMYEFKQKVNKKIGEKNGNIRTKTIKKPKIIRSNS